MKIKNLITMMLSLLLFYSCKKDKVENVTISGNVRNDCTGIGFANVTVYLINNYSHSSLFNKKNSSDKTTAITNSNGDFVFNDYPIHQNSDYSYSLYIEDESRYLIGEYGHSGGNWEIDKDKAEDFKQIGLIAIFKQFTFQLSQTVTTMAPDTFTIHFQQNILHYYEPFRVYDATLYPRYFYIGTGVYSYNYAADYPMGWWHINIDKTRNGLHTVTNDSVFLDMGSTGTYTIPW